MDDSLSAIMSMLMCVKNLNLRGDVELVTGSPLKFELKVEGGKVVTYGINTEKQ